jgi:hypothetical protein
MICCGVAKAIVQFLYGNRALRRKVYHLFASRLADFKLRAMICARKSVLLEGSRIKKGHHAGGNRKQA